MREIKFRAWLKKDETMYHVRTVNFDKEIVFLIEFDNEDDMAFHEHFNQIELMQYTGLKDCKGKEIYEGDITTHHKFNTVEKWVYHDKLLQYIAIESDGTHRYYFDRDKEELEVIGNIYENPELLEVE